LPVVKWGNREISRLPVGHNPLKGQSYSSRALDQEMKEWFKPDKRHGVELLQRCRQVNINTCESSRWTPSPSGSSNAACGNRPEVID